LQKWGRDSSSNPTKYGRAQSSKPKLSGNGCSHIIREPPKSAACCQSLRLQLAVLTRTNKLILDLPKDNPADRVVATKVYSLASSISCHIATKLIYGELSVDRSESLVEGVEKINRVLYVV